MATFWGRVIVEWLDGRTETYDVGGYASRRDAIQAKDGVLSLYMGNNAYAEHWDHLASIPLANVRFWKVSDR